MKESDRQTAAIPMVVGYSRNSQGRIISRHIKETANTIHASTGGGGDTDQYIINPNTKDMEKANNLEYRIRKLTPRECYRLMGVPEYAIDRIQNAVDASGKPVVSKTQQYKQAGNSIVCQCLKEIYRKLFIDTAITKPYQLSLFD